MIQQKIQWVAADMAATEGAKNVDLATIFAVVEAIYAVYQCMQKRKGSAWRRQPLLRRKRIRRVMRGMSPPLEDEALVNSLTRLSFITTDEEVAEAWEEIRLGQGGAIGQG